MYVGPRRTRPALLGYYCTGSVYNSTVRVVQRGYATTGEDDTRDAPQNVRDKNKPPENGGLYVRINKTH